MKPSAPCPDCGSDTPNRLRRQHEALRQGDLDAALAHGLMDAAPCPRCTEASGLATDALAMLEAARRERMQAWAARERHRARQLRLERIAEEESRRRRGSITARTGSGSGALPPAAAAALARALAKAAGAASK